jgi:predicted exporter
MGGSLDSPMDDAIAILVVAVFSGAFFWSLYDAARRPGRYHALMNNLSAWQRIKWSIAAITVGVAVAFTLRERPSTPWASSAWSDSHSG